MLLVQSQEPEAWGRLREVLRQARVLGEVEKHLKKFVRPAVKSQPVSGQAEGFKINETGVWYHPPHDPAEDPKPPVWICGPLAVTAYTRNVDDEGWGRLLEFKDLEDRTHTWAMPVRLLHTESSEYRAVLADLDLVIASGRSRTHDLLKDYIQSVNPSAWVRCVEHTGWQGGAFVLPDEVIGDTGGERVLLQTVNGSRHVYRQAGTLED